MDTQSISVYGYDQHMLSTPDLPAPSKWQPVLPLNSELDVSNHISGRCHLLELPPELRKLVWLQLLPRTSHTPYKGIVWHRGNISILSTCKRIYAETIPQIYSQNTFLIDVVWDCSTFANQWILSSRLVPKREIAFPEGIAVRNRALLRKFWIRIKHVDSYTGMVKYNYGGLGLTAGLQDQVKFLCQTLRGIPEIWSLHVDLSENNADAVPDADAILLEPFLSLKNTRTVSLSGSISREYGLFFKSRLTNAYHKNSLLRLPPEIRSQIYAYVFSPPSSPRTRSKRSEGPEDHRGPGSAANSQPPIKPHSPTNPAPSILSITYTSSLIHKEATQTLYSTTPFILSLYHTLLWLSPAWSSDSTNSLRRPRGVPEDRFYRDSGFKYLSYARILIIDVPASWDDGEARCVHSRVLHRLGAVLGGGPAGVGRLECVTLKIGFGGVVRWMQDELRGMVEPLLRSGRLERFEVEGLWGVGECEWLRRRISGEAEVDGWSEMDFFWD